MKIARANSQEDKFHYTKNTLVGDVDETRNRRFYRADKPTLDQCCFCESRLRSGECKKRGCSRNKFLDIAISRARGGEVIWPEDVVA